jgi:hypothetical protein
MEAKSVVLAACIISGLSSATVANAGIHFPGIGSNSNSSSSSDVLAAQDSLVRSFVASQREILTAQSLLAKAYGLKDQAEACDVQEKALESAGTDTDALKKTVDVSNAANEAISAQQAKQATLTAEEKGYYGQSLPHFAKGVVGTRDVVVQAEKFTTSAKGSMTGLSGLAGGMTKLKAGAFIARSVPSYSKSLFDVFRKTLSIGRNNGVSVPDDATQALSSL